MTTTDLHRHQDLNVRPGESEPAGMLGGVLVMLATVMLVGAVALAWWLA